MSLLNAINHNKKHSSVELAEHTPPVISHFVQFGVLALSLCAFDVVLADEPAKGEFSGNISLEARYFNHDGAFLGQQKSGGVSVSVEPEYKYKWDDYKQINVKTFFRWDDEDKERTHADIRQLDFVTSTENWEFQVGIGRVFWGVTESQHLVDVINQTDSVEGTDGEAKLGQPMLHASRFTENGSVDFFVLPYFRERTFSGVNGRFRLALPVDENATTYESSSKEKHLDYAIRWAETMDAFDVGVHYFDGTSRDPMFSPATATTLRAHYPLIRQVGLDIQYTGEDTIWKFEAINRNFKATIHKDYTAFVGGFEHSLPAFESGADLSLLAEYHHDSRGYKPTVAYQNDLFIGARYALNDENSSELLAGAFIDLDDQSKTYRIEASRRVGKGLKLNVEAQVFSDIDATNPLKNFEKDNFIQVELQKFF